MIRFCLKFVIYKETKKKKNISSFVINDVTLHFEICKKYKQKLRTQSRDKINSFLLLIFHSSERIILNFIIYNELRYFFNNLTLI